MTVAQRIDMTAGLLEQSTGLERIDDLVDAEFREMPGMRLTEAQVRRLWNLSPAECRTVLKDLVDTGRLFRDASGRYTRCRFPA
jgi:hypothetical protein